MARKHDSGRVRVEEARPFRLDVQPRTHLSHRRRGEGRFRNAGAVKSKHGDGSVPSERLISSRAARLLLGVPGQLSLAA